MNTLFILINSLRGRSEVFGNSAFSSNRKGFTLIEQLIVTVTIGILIAVAIPIRDAEASSTVKYKYNGVVRDTSGDPVEDATITVFIANKSSSLNVYESQDSETTVSSVTSDSDGSFEFWLGTDDSEYTTSDIFNIKVTYTEPNGSDDVILTDSPTSYYVNNISIFPTNIDNKLHNGINDIRSYKLWGAPSGGQLLTNRFVLPASNSRGQSWYDNFLYLEFLFRNKGNEGYQSIKIHRNYFWWLNDRDDVWRDGQKIMDSFAISWNSSRTSLYLIGNPDREVYLFTVLGHKRLPDFREEKPLIF